MYIFFPYFHKSNLKGKVYYFNENKSEILDNGKVILKDVKIGDTSQIFKDNLYYMFDPETKYYLSIDKKDNTLNFSLSKDFETIVFFANDNDKNIDKFSGDILDKNNYFDDLLTDEEKDDELEMSPEYYKVKFEDIFEQRVLIYGEETIRDSKIVTNILKKYDPTWRGAKEVYPDEYDIYLKASKENGNMLGIFINKKFLFVPSLYRNYDENLMSTFTYREVKALGEMIADGNYKLALELPEYSKNKSDIHGSAIYLKIKDIITYGWTKNGKLIFSASSSKNLGSESWFDDDYAEKVVSIFNEKYEKEGIQLAFERSPFNDGKKSKVIIKNNSESVVDSWEKYDYGTEEYNNVNIVLDDGFIKNAFGNTLYEEPVKEKKEKAKIEPGMIDCSSFILSDYDNEDFIKKHKLEKKYFVNLLNFNVKKCPVYKRNNRPYTYGTPKWMRYDETTGNIDYFDNYYNDLDSENYTKIDRKFAKIVHNTARGINGKSISIVLCGCGSLNEFITFLSEFANYKEITLLCLDLNLWPKNTLDDIIKYCADMQGACGWSFNLYFYQCDFYDEFIKRGDCYKDFDIFYFSRCILNGEKCNGADIDIAKRMVDAIPSSNIYFSQVIKSDNYDAFKFEGDLCATLWEYYHVKIYGIDGNEYRYPRKYRQFGVTFYLYKIY